jgi:ATP-dependent Clp protease adaptor protein ClpS
MEDTDSSVALKQRVEVKPPGMYKVVLLNDDVTPMDFVIKVLETIFELSKDESFLLTMQIHELGSGIAGIYVRDVALSKVEHVKVVSEVNGFDLKVIAEEV